MLYSLRFPCLKCLLNQNIKFAKKLAKYYNCSTLKHSEGAMNFDFVCKLQHNALDKIQFSQRSILFSLKQMEFCKEETTKQMFTNFSNSIAFNGMLQGRSIVFDQFNLYISSHIIIYLFCFILFLFLNLHLIVLLQVALRYKTIQAEFSLNIVVTGFIIVDVSIYINKMYF